VISPTSVTVCDGGVGGGGRGEGKGSKGSSFSYPTGTVRRERSLEKFQESLILGTESPFVGVARNPDFRP